MHHVSSDGSATAIGHVAQKDVWVGGWYLCGVGHGHVAGPPARVQPVDRQLLPLALAAPGTSTQTGPHETDGRGTKVCVSWSHLMSISHVSPRHRCCEGPEEEDEEEEARPPYSTRHAPTGQHGTERCLYHTQRPERERAMVRPEVVYAIQTACWPWHAGSPLLSHCAADPYPAVPTCPEGLGRAVRECSRRGLGLPGPPGDSTIQSGRGWRRSSSHVSL